MIKKLIFVTILSFTCVGGLIYASQKWLTPTEGKMQDNTLPDALDPNDGPLIGIKGSNDLEDTGALMQAMGTSNKVITIQADPKTRKTKYIFVVQSVKPNNAENSIDVKEPRIVYYFAENRFMEISAMEGVFRQRGTVPETGTFKGQVKMKIFEGAPGQYLTYTQDLEPSMTIFFPGQDSKVNFDSIKSQVDSLDHVHLTSEEVEFKGQGLTLIFNERTNQIQELIIDRGEFLRYTQAKPAPLAPAPPAIFAQMGASTLYEDTDADRRQRQRPSMSDRLDSIHRQRDAEKNRKGLIGIYEDEDQPKGRPNQPGRIPQNSPERSDELQPAPRLSDYYQINIYDNIKIYTPEGHIRCKEMELYIANKPSDGDSVNPFGDRQASAESQSLRAPASPNPTGSNSPFPPAAPLPLAGSKPVKQENARRFNTVLKGADLHMTWTGKLVMRPLAEGKEPPRRLVNYDDMFVRFIGSKEEGTYAETDNYDQVFCQTIDYQTEFKDAHLIGSKEHPLRMISQQSGELGDAQELLIRLDTGVGHIPSGGYLQSSGKDKAEQALASGHQATESEGLALNSGKGMPENFRIQWSRRLDFSFAPQRASDRGMRSARFDGDVIVTDPRFKMTSNQLVAEFTQTAQKTNRQLSSIQTSGRTKAVTDQGSTLEADSMRIETREDESGKLSADQLIAKGKVIVQDPKQRIESEKLVAYLASKEEKALAEAQQAKEQQQGKNKQNLPVGLRRIYAEENVKLFLEDGTVVRSETLESDVLKKDALLTGEPVHVTRQDNYFITPLLKIQEGGKKVWGIGGGDLYHVEDPEDLKETRKTGEAPKRRDMRVTWQDEMFFNDLTNTVVFTGKVISKTTDKPNEQHRLDADKLTLFLEKKEEEKQDQAENQNALAATGSGARQLKQMLAEKNVTMISTKWVDPQRKKIEQQFMLQGDHLVYDETKKESLINGPGVMLIQDLREDPQPKPQKKEEEANNIKSASASITGRGQTRFRWKESWKAARSTNDLVMKGDVSMVHIPLNQDQPTYMAAQQMSAKMKNLREMRDTQITGGEEMKIDYIHLTGNAQLADQKYRVAAGDMYYYAEKKTMRLEAGRQRSVFIQDKDRPSPIQAQKILWYLESGRFEILEARHGG